MQQRQPRLGDILDDYCPRERRLTNHAVVAMVGDAVKQTRCTTCESEHEYKHAKVPKPRKKPDESTLYSQVLAGVAPRRVSAPEPTREQEGEVEVERGAPEAEPLEDHAAAFDGESAPPAFRIPAHGTAHESSFTMSAGDVEAGRYDADEAHGEEQDGGPSEEGPVHRQLIRAQLPRHEGQVPVARQAPDFTIRMPAAGRANRFRPRPQRGGPQVQGNRSGGPQSGGHSRGAGARPQGGGRPHDRSRSGPRRGSGRNRPK